MVNYKYKIGQLVYDEYYGLGMITQKNNFEERYQEYRIDWQQPSPDPDDEGTDFGWFSEDWISDKVDEPCLILDLPSTR